MSPDCRRFRATFEPGEPAAHRAGCLGCDAFARVVETARAGGAKLPLPAGLEARLRAIAAPAAAAEPVLAPAVVLDLPLPLPSLPLPAGLAARLEAIARPVGPAAGRPRLPLPAWVRSPAASLAASLVAVVVCGLLWGDPVAASQPLAGELGERWTEVQARGREGWVCGVLLPAQETFDRSLIRSRQLFASWHERLVELEAEVRDGVTPTITNPD